MLLIMINFVMCIYFYSLSPNTDSSSCSKDYSVSNCQACHYSTALQPSSSCNFDCVDNNGEYDDACMSDWGACLFQKYSPIFHSVRFL